MTISCISNELSNSIHAMKTTNIHCDLSLTMEQPLPSVANSGVRPRNIASVRVASLRASGLRAASRACNNLCDQNVTYNVSQTTPHLPNMVEVKQVTTPLPDLTSSPENTACTWMSPWQFTGAHNKTVDEDIYVKNNYCSPIDASRKVLEKDSTCVSRSPKRLKTGEGYTVYTMSSGQCVSRTSRNLSMNFNKEKVEGSHEMGNSTIHEKKKDCGKSSVVYPPSLTDSTTKNVKRVLELEGSGVKTLNQQDISPLSNCMETKKILSYTDSQDSQDSLPHNTLLSIDRLVWLNSSDLCGEPVTKVEDKQPLIHDCHFAKRIKALSHTADMKGQSNDMSVFEFPDSQPDEAELVSMVNGFSAHGKKHSTHKETRKAERRSKGDISAKSARKGKKENKKAREKHNNCVQPLVSDQNSSRSELDKSVFDVDELHVTGCIADMNKDTTLLEGREITPPFVVGNDTQIALEAMNIIQCSSTLNTVSEKEDQGKQTARNSDILSRACMFSIDGTEVDNGLELRAHGNSSGEEAYNSAAYQYNIDRSESSGDTLEAVFDTQVATLDAGINTQVAIEAINLLSAENDKFDPGEQDVGFINRQKHNKFEMSGNDVCAATKVMNDSIKCPDEIIGNNTQVALEVIDAIRYGNESTQSLPTAKEHNQVCSRRDANESMEDQRSYVNKFLYDRFVNDKVNGLEATKSYDEPVDEGACTQAALEALDLMTVPTTMKNIQRHSNETFADDIACTQVALEALDMLTVFCGSDGSEKEDIPTFCVEANSQTRKEELNCNIEKKTSKKSANHCTKDTCGNKHKSVRFGLPAGPDIDATQMMASIRNKVDAPKADLISAETNLTCRPAFHDKKGSSFETIGVGIPKRKRSRRSAAHVLSSKMLLFLRHQIAPVAQNEMNEENRTVISEVQTSSRKENLFRKNKKTKQSDFCSSLTPSRRQTKQRDFCTVSVLFSHNLPQETVNYQKKVLVKLGGHVANSSVDSTHFVTNAFFRTRNMLESIASGKNIVTTDWLEACSQLHYFVDEKNYTLHDLKKEKEIGFSLKESLATSKCKPLLRGMSFIVSPNTVPDYESTKSIIECAGGQVVEKTNASQSSIPDAKSLVVIASNKDYGFCVPYIRRGFSIYSMEFLLRGIVLQNLDFSRDRLFKDSAC